MIRPTLAVLAIVAIAAMMGAASVAPAYAAKPIANVNEQTFQVIKGVRDICEETVDAETTVNVNFKGYEDGTFKLHMTTLKKYVNPDTGEAVGHSNSVLKIHETAPFSMQDNETIICLNAENTKTHMGMSFHVDGNLKFHFQSH